MKTIRYLSYMFFFFPCLLLAQESDLVTYPEKNKLLKPEYHFHLGSHFTFFPGYGSFSGILAGPSVSVPLSKRFSTEGGLIISSSVWPGYFPKEFNRTFHNQYNLAIYGSTAYKASPRLTFYGTGIKQLINNTSLFPFYPIRSNSFTLGSSFRLSKGLAIGASIHFSEGYYNNYFHPGREQNILSSPGLW